MKGQSRGCPTLNVTYAIMWKAGCSLGSVGSCEQLSSWNQYFSEKKQITESNSSPAPFIYMCKIRVPLLGPRETPQHLEWCWNKIFLLFEENHFFFTSKYERTYYCPNNFPLGNDVAPGPVLHMVGRKFLSEDSGREVERKPEGSQAQTWPSVRREENAESASKSRIVQSQSRERGVRSGQSSSLPLRTGAASSAARY